jgi:bifunctional non-homologous end joining protein LigD
VPTVDVGGRHLSLSNLDKVLYPEAGFTKAEVIDYYHRVAPFLIPHLEGRALTLRRWPNGVDRPGFFEKRCPSHRPPWLPTAPGPGDHNGTIQYCRFDEPAALVWAANMAALELHAPMARAVDIESPVAVVFDLDPGAPAAMRECCIVALEIRDVLARLDLVAVAKTSGSKGLQLYVPVNAPISHDDAGGFALAVAQIVEQRRPKDVVTVMTKAERRGKIFIDWSQNSRHKTTVAVYSLRARPRPTVSTPVTWDEVEAGAAGAALQFEAADVLDRVATGGDLFAPLLTLVQDLPRR